MASIVFFHRVSIFSFVIFLLCCNIDTANSQFSLTYSSLNSLNYTCLPNWILVGNKCYYPIFEETDWRSALEICNSVGGTIANPKQHSNNVVLLNAIENNANYNPHFGSQSLWLGYQTRKNATALWSPASLKETSAYISNWIPREPSIIEIIGCITLNQNNETIGWSTNECEQIKPFVCQIRSCPGGYRRCQDDKLCILNSKWCDNYKDCEDNSDELACPNKNGCGGFIEDHSGVITSPNFPSSYSNDLDCKWIIKGPLNSTIKIVIESFEIEEPYDTLDVYDGSAIDDNKLIERLTGYYRLPKYLQISKSNTILLHFLTDFQGSENGFKLSWSTVGGCGGRLVASDTTQSLSSVNFPSPYPQNEDCFWIISAVGAIYIQIEFENFDLEESIAFLNIHDGESSQSPRIASLTGRQLPFPLISTGNKVFLHFKVMGRNSIQAKGFKLFYKTGCDVTLNFNFGKIFSPGFNTFTNYPHRLNCKWTIKAPSNSALTLAFRFFHTEENFDIVTVYNNTNQQQPTNTFSGTSIPETIRSNVGQFVVTFTTNSERSFRGWSADFSYDCSFSIDFGNPPNVIVPFTSSFEPSCQNGYYLNGSKSLICTYNGKWSHPLPTCKPVNCGSPPAILGGLVIEINGHLFENSATYKCNPGYDMIKNPTITCLSTGQWSLAPECKPVSCPAPSTLENGHISNSSCSDKCYFQDTVLYKCDDGFSMAGNPIIYCNEYRNWSESVPTCKIRFCARPEIPNGNVNGSGPFKFNSSATFICRSGYHFLDTNTGFCSMTGQWVDLPICQDINECSNSESNICIGECVNTEGSYKCICPDGYQPALGSEQVCIDVNECLNNNGGCDKNCHNTQGSFYCSCPEGHELFTKNGTQNNYLKPGETGLNPGDSLILNKSCVLVACPIPLGIANSITVGSINSENQFVFGDRIEYRCLEGFYLSGSSEIKCTAQGTWTNNNTKCVAYICTPPPNINHGGYETSDPTYSVGAIITYNCITGYQLEGNRRRECKARSDQGNRTFIWTGTQPVCKPILCPSISAPQNGYLYGLSLEYKEEVQFICKPGFTLHGSSSRTCFANGSWSGAQPICSGAVCSEPLLSNHITINENNFILGAIITFSCSRPGFILDGRQSLQCSLGSVIPRTSANSSSLMCYSCNNATSSLDCNQFTSCEDNEVCSVEWNKSDDIITFNKGCRSRNVCQESSSSNSKACLTSGNSCSLCCSQSFCNIAPEDESFKPVWNGNPPQCKDITPPTFNTCPSTIWALFGANGKPLPTAFDYPTASDNSGIKPTFSSIPANLSSPYIFPKDMEVSIFAHDQAGNIANCSFNVQFNDTIPPTIHCPLQKILHSVYATTQTFPASFPDVYVTDNIAVKEILYEPPNGTVIPLNEAVVVTVIATDDSGNTGRCSFNYEMTTYACVEWSLTIPEFTNFICTPPVHGPLETIISCKASCRNSSYAPIEAFPLQYICTEGQGWKNSYIPDCQIQRIPPINILIHLGFFNFRNASDCFFIYEQLLYNMEHQFSQVCSSTINTLFDVMIKDVHLSIGNSVVIIGKINIQLLPNQHDMRTSLAMIMCQNKLQQYFNTTTVDLVPDSAFGCQNLTSILQNTSVITENDCQPGYIKDNRNRFCLSCPIGTFYNSNNSSKCQNCPAGSYQNDEAQTSCKNCPPKTGTLNDRNSNISACVGFCNPGEFSPTGLVPCAKCEIGTYAPDNGSRACISCDADKSTIGLGSSSIEDCRDLCSPGSYSQDTFEPCSPCPVNFYQDISGTNYCRECPPDKVTLSEGSNSFTNCIRVDQCENHKCENGATCDNKHRYYDCICAPGFEGNMCEINIDECESDPCFNGATCHDGINSFTCECAPGFIGDLCQNGTDECEPQPCENGGTCIDKHLDYDCVCVPGFSDKNCSTNIDECASNPCENGGICIDQINGFECDCTDTGFEGVICQINIDDCLPQPCNNRTTVECIDGIKNFTCICVPGFTGEVCEIDIDECLSNPCQNHGICDDLENGYSCTCQPGYEGVNCEIDTDECQSNPCQHNSTCEDKVNGYLCHCVPGYEGANCEIDIDECAMEPCQNGATCIDLIANYSCICAPGYEGYNCSDMTDECEPEPCQNGGTCQDLHLNYFCHCAPGFMGNDCEIDIDECLSSPCIHGNCSDGINYYNCSCFSGWTGVNCEIDIDECESSPCLNGGTCVDLINAFMCRCAIGFTGDTCQIDIDDCLSNPCQNGNCTDKVNDYSCTCFPGYSGKDCDIDIDECISSPCLNNGTCIDLINGYYCNCTEEYNGTDCEFQIDDCLLNNTCKNGATCVDGWRDISCICTPEFYGPQCDRRKSDVFDLLFFGQSGSISDPPPVSATAAKEITICFWVRFGGQNSKGTYLSLLNVRNSTKSVILEFEEEQLLLQTDNSLNIMPFKTNNGSWTHVCFAWNLISGEWKLFKYGFLEQIGVNFRTGFQFDSLQVILGQSQAYKADKFFGELSRVNVWQRILSEDEIAAVSYNCTSWREYGDLRLWVEFAEHLKNDVELRKPGLCGQSNCTIGWEGTNCTIINDRIPPEVEFCPGDMKFVNQTRLIQAIWPQPIFTDKVGIDRVESNYISGSWFTWGEYLVTYAAYDLGGNIATCSFIITITPFNCSEPDPPVNGISTCDTHFYGLFCTIRCISDYFDFIENIPPFYSCAREGLWDINNPSVPFAFPKCASLFGAITGIEGMFEYEVECTEEKKQEALEHFKATINEVNAAINVCAERDCDFSRAVVKCGEINLEAKRRKRNSDTITIEFFIPTNETFNATDEIEKSVKNGTFDNGPIEVIKGNFILNNAFICNPGAILKENKCVYCPVGNYFDNLTETCKECELSYYQSLEGQFSCNRCPDNKSTERTGTANVAECYKNCAKGEYYNKNWKSCMKCNKGTYQEKEGQINERSCIPCREGFTTEDEGTQESSGCSVYCQLGQELAGDEFCEPCPVGTYRSDQSYHQCKQCPHNFTTAGSGTISLKDCSLPVKCVDYCQNNGLCSLVDFEPKCYCHYDFNGERCEFKVSHFTMNLLIIGISIAAGLVFLISVVSCCCCLIRSNRKKSPVEVPRTKIGWSYGISKSSDDYPLEEYTKEHYVQKPIDPNLT